jgi:hypothetical protein
MPEDRARELVGKATRLRTEVARTALDLHRVSDEIARQAEFLAVNRRPPRTDDLAVAAKRWRAIAEMSLAAAETWREGPEPSVAAAVQERLVVETLDDIVSSGLFAVGLRLDALLPLAGGELRSHLEEAVRGLDHCIQALQQAAFELGDQRGRET